MTKQSWILLKLDFKCSNFVTKEGTKTEQCTTTTTTPAIPSTESPKKREIITWNPLWKILSKFKVCVSTVRNSQWMLGQSVDSFVKQDLFVKILFPSSLKVISGQQVQYWCRVDFAKSSVLVLPCQFYCHESRQLAEVRKYPERIINWKLNNRRQM